MEYLQKFFEIEAKETKSQYAPLSTPKHPSIEDYIDWNKVWTL